MTNPAPDDDLEKLLVFLKANRNFDFTGYKRASLQRRIDRRMQDVRVAAYDKYMKLLDEDPAEFARLFDTVLINVTAFFRDDVPWQMLRETVIPELIGKKGPSSPLRVWSAGCASGEEAYTIAMIISEELGENAFRERVKIYATDVDESALRAARQGVYSEKAVAPVPAALREKYFERIDGEFAFRKDLRRAVVFGRNDLITDAPISHVDLLVCRNTLMYFNAETQERILNRFRFALNEEGVLFLGRAETLLTHSSLFTPIDAQRRLFTRSSHPVFTERRGAWLSPLIDSTARALPPVRERLREAAFDAAAVAQLIFDRNGFLTFATERARALFGIVPSDVGRPLQDLQMSYRPVELRSSIEAAYNEQASIYLRNTAWHTSEERWFDIAVTPLSIPGAPPAGVSVTFTDVTQTARLQRELERSNHLLEVSYEELQSTHEEMQTTNEELQSTVEELETTNEELQSTNEELETMNEELQATNDELHTVNTESQRRSDELIQLNAFLESVFSSLRGAVVVVDREMRVIVWSARAEDLWGLRAKEVEGSPFFKLDIGLPVDELLPTMKTTLDDGMSTKEMTIAARNRRGKDIRCRVSFTQLRAPGEDSPRGVILQMEEFFERVK